MAEQPARMRYKVLDNSTLEVTPNAIVEIQCIGRSGWLYKVYRYHVSEESWWLAEEQVFTSTEQLLDEMSSELGTGSLDFLLQMERWKENNG